jgi:hypothetical protein
MSRPGRQRSFSLQYSQKPLVIKALQLYRYIPIYLACVSVQEMALDRKTKAANLSAGAQ